MVFAQQLQKVDSSKPQDAIVKMYNHIRYIQEQLEYTLLNLDSSNINEIDISKTNITDSQGTTNIGTYIHLTGSNGEEFTVGQNPSGAFEFTVKGKGTTLMVLDSSGNLHISKTANLTIDGGEW